MYEELRGNLMAQATHFSVHDETSLLLLKAADAIEDLENRLNLWRQDKIRRWIPITERLPEDRNMVLATVDGVVRIAFYGNYMWEEVETYSIFYPTHWMPLPQPPESEGKT